ncbi:MAG: OmpH family outer membrane protein [Bacteroidia bacterium]|nr:OmpH family outer membrane protein [Bacteroidia bacterium]
MRKSVLSLVVLLMVSLTASAQKFALIDMEYIMQHIPAYNKANEEIQNATKKYQTAVEEQAKEAQALFKAYQAKVATLSATQKTQKEDQIVAKEKAVTELKRQYFGPEGELAKLQKQLMQPIQDAVYNAVKQLSEEYGYSLVLDRASASSIIFASPRIDISNEVLAKLGYSN